MDRAEAIYRLRVMVVEADTKADIQALDLAIEALKREIEYGQMVVDFTKGEKVDDWVYDEDETATTTDCISRADTIKALCQECEMKCVCNHDCTEVAVIKGMPPVTPTERTGEWIPVSERLPEGYAQYLCYCEGGDCYVFWLDNEPWAEETVEKERILAWMPLPEPYKDGDTE